MISKLKLKHFLDDDHTLEEHLSKIYQVMFQLMDKIDDLEQEIEELKNNKNSYKVRVR